MSYGSYPNLENVQRILVIKLRHLGDVLLASPVFSSLKEKFPSAEIDAYLWKESYPMLEGHPAISNFFLYDRLWKNFFFLFRFIKEFSLLRKIRKKKYDLVINLTEGDRGAIAGWFSKAKIFVGIDPEKKGFWQKKKLYSHLVKPCALPRHTVERNLDALRCIGIFPNQNKREIFFSIPKEAETNVKKLLEKEGLKKGEFVVIHAPSRWRFKCLPSFITAQIIDELRETVVLTGGSSSSEMLFVSEIIKISKSSNIKNFCGRISLKELGALLTMTKGLITVDSVTLHLASALKIPVVALFGPTSELNWGPWQNPYARVVSKNISCRPCFLDGCGGSKMSDCLWTLSPQKVLQAFKQVGYSVSCNVSVFEDAGSSCCASPELFVLNSLEIKKTE